MGENLAERIIDGALASGWGERTALCEGERTLSYDLLADRVKRTASALQGLGVKVGDRVAIYMPDCLEAAISILGTMYAGAIAMPVSELSAVLDLRDRLNDAGATVVLVHTSLRDNLAEIKAEVESLVEVVSVGEGERSGSEHDFAKLINAATPATAQAISDEDPALLLYSAGASIDGSQLNPRGVAHCHKTPIRAFDSFGLGLAKLVSDDRVFSTVRLSTAYGLGTGLLFPLLAGAQTLLLPEQPHSSLIFESLKSFKPTIFAATPSVYCQLSRDATIGHHKNVLSGTRLCIAGAEDMPAKIIAMVRGVLGTDVIVGYGLTEAFQFVLAGAPAGKRPGGCGGLMDGFEIRILDDDGNPTGVDEIGTLQIRGESIIKQYWGKLPMLADDGWFPTLDRFMMDAEQQYYHCGRVDHHFKVGGRWVAPGEVERALLAHEAVWECAVIGADDEDGLIKPFAFVVPNIGQSPGDELEALLREYVKNELAPYKYPRWIEFIDELPKGQKGVILRYKLRDRLKQSRSRRRAELPSG